MTLADIEARLGTVPLKCHCVAPPEHFCDERVPDYPALAHVVQEILVDQALVAEVKALREEHEALARHLKDVTVINAYPSWIELMTAYEAVEAARVR